MPQRNKIGVRRYWPLIKSLQTALLLITGLAGYMSARCPVTHLPTILALSGSLFLAISGSTILNMWYDQDIDAQMTRTCRRPLPADLVSSREALVLGLGTATLGVGWAFWLDPLYGGIVFAGLFFDVAVYTVWLKRRTAWSILWGGISGGMPALAGRALGTGTIDWIGVAFCLAVLFWIPTHIMTINLRHSADYRRAGIPTFPSRYGVAATRTALAVSSVMAILFIISTAVGIGMSWGYLRLLAVLSAILFVQAVRSAWRPSERANFRLFKYASTYMLGVMLLIVATGIL